MTILVKCAIFSAVSQCLLEQLRMCCLKTVVDKLNLLPDNKAYSVMFMTNMPSSGVDNSGTKD